MMLIRRTRHFAGTVFPNLRNGLGSLYHQPSHRPPSQPDRQLHVPSHLPHRLDPLPVLCRGRQLCPPRFGLYKASDASSENKPHRIQ